ncbi:hypothetical protein SCP_0210500 [Sparassis crispa]|uniref:Uncharacterized protein n=1 Tax=Sparassis crispa TaxID=139825 RepID=A0A401GCE6_9APHY|nr:hypothetical protein SCP_0210500 [Sparassis crispa]GBE79849.1 hypothetical protein SCP_0210500 [Sparassis crispa]
MPHRKSSFSTSSYAAAIAKASSEELLQYQNEAYIQLYRERDELVARERIHEEKYAKLISAIPSVLHGVPPSQISSVATDIRFAKANPIPPLERAEYPSVRFWYRQEYDAHIRELSESRSITQIDEDESEDGPKKPRYLENKDGTPFNKAQMKAATRVMREIWAELHCRDDVSYLPSTWSKKTADIAAFFYREMNLRIPELAYCHGDWKAEKLATDNYSQWTPPKKNKKKQSLSEPVDQSDESDSEVRPRRRRGGGKKKRHNSTMSENDHEGSLRRRRDSKRKRNQSSTSDEEGRNTRSPRRRRARKSPRHRSVVSRDDSSAHQDSHYQGAQRIHAPTDNVSTIAARPVPEPQPQASSSSADIDAALPTQSSVLDSPLPEHQPNASSSSATIDAALATESSALDSPLPETQPNASSSSANIDAALPTQSSVLDSPLPEHQPDTSSLSANVDNSVDDDTIPSTSVVALHTTHADAQSIPLLVPFDPLADEFDPPTPHSLPTQSKTTSASGTGVAPADSDLGAITADAPAKPKRKSPKMKANKSNDASNLFAINWLPMNQGKSRDEFSAAWAAVDAETRKKYEVLSATKKTAAKTEEAAKRKASRATKATNKSNANIAGCGRLWLGIRVLLHVEAGSTGDSFGAWGTMQGGSEASAMQGTGRRGGRGRERDGAGQGGRERDGGMAGAGLLGLQRTISKDNGPNHSLSKTVDV